MQGAKTAQKPARQGSKVKQLPLERYFTVLETIAAYPEASATLVSDYCRLPFGTTHRLIQSLLATQLLTSDGGKRKSYSLGPRLLRLLLSGSDETWLRTIVQKTLDKVAMQHAETCYIAKLAPREIVSMAWAAPQSGLRGYVVPGSSQPLHAAASAKAILAFHSDEFVSNLLPRPLLKLCTRTKTEIGDVLAELATVREKGYAICINENEAGVAAVACPVLIPGFEVMYSIGVMGLCDRLPPERLAEIAKSLKAAASHVGRNIHHRLPQLVLAEQAEPQYPESR